MFLTNNFRLAALTVADPYQEHWQIELVLKWIEQNLKIKRFPTGVTNDLVQGRGISEPRGASGPARGRQARSRHGRCAAAGGDRHSDDDACAPSGGD